jgi:hypothetical protein
MALRLSVPAAIVIGSAIAGGASFLGLRSRPVVAVVSPVRTGVELIPQSATTGEIASAQSNLARLVRDTIEHDRPRLVQACWPSGQQAPPKDFQLRLIFDGSGQLLSYAVNDPGEAIYQPVARCLRRQKPMVAVPAVGHPTTIQFALRLP